MPTLLELVSFKKYTGEHALVKHNTLYQTAICRPEEGNYTLAQLIIRAYKPGEYTVYGSYYMDCYTYFGVRHF